LSTNYISTRRPSSSSNDSTISPKTKKDVIKREITRLLDVRFLKEVYHPDWLANPVLVQKREGGCVLIIKILISNVTKIPLACPELIRLWTPRLVAAF
jgi:hypothetical protein